MKGIKHARFAFGTAAMTVGGLILAGGLWASADSGPARAGLPTLPPPSQLEPGLFDDNGCPLFPESDDPSAKWLPACGPASSSDSSPAPDQSTELRLRGFVGTHFAGPLSAGRVVLQSSTISVETSGPWHARGLVRNESDGLADAEVVATLRDSSGNVLETVDAQVLVSPLRSGEPGPFDMTSSVDARDVADVDWRVDQRPAGAAVKRDFLITTNWAVPYGFRPAIDNYYLDPVGGPPYPLVLEGDVENVGTPAVGNPLVTVAWLDPDGKVSWVAQGRAGVLPYRADEAASFPPAIKSMSTRPFVIAVTDPAVNEAVATATPMFWAAS